MHGTRLTLCPSVQTRNALRVLARLQASIQSQSELGNGRLVGPVSTLQIPELTWSADENPSHTRPGVQWHLGQVQKSCCGNGRTGD